MDFLVDQLRLLGLNDREIRVFTALSTFGRLNMTKLAARAGIARTTADAIIRRLIEQGLVAREKVRGHFEYAVLLNDVADKLDWIEKRLRTKSEGGVGSMSTPPSPSHNESTNDEKIVIKDTSETVQISEAFSLHRSDRVRLLLARSVTDVEDAVGRFKMYVEDATQNNTLLEVLMCSRVADALHHRKGYIPVPSNSDAVRINIVPAAYCKADADVLVFRDVVYILQVQSRAVERVNNQIVVETTKHLLDIACETGWSINLGAWLE